MDEIFYHEDGYVDHPKDPGGATNMGITHKTLAAWRKVSPWSDLPKSEVKNLSKDEARKIYEANYWRAVKGDDLPSGVDLFVMDYGVNSGPSRAVKALQTVVGVPADGVIGPVTLEAVRKTDPLKIVNELYKYRMQYLRSLKTWSTFGKGWTRRVDSVHKVSQELVGRKTPNPDELKGGSSDLLQTILRLILKLLGK